MVKLYCKKINHDEKDRKLDVKDHEELDDLPRKSVGQQVEAFLLAGERLEMGRRAMFELESNYEDVDIDSLDTGIDEYSDVFDLNQAQQDLNEKFAQVNKMRKEQEMSKKQQEQQQTKQQEQKVEKVEKVE